MLLKDYSCTDFAAELASKAPVPGGGGVAALTGALGTALGRMVCSLTSGKKKYADVEEDIQRINAEAEKIQTRLLELIDEDAQNFYPLSQAYGLPKDTEEQKAKKEETLQACFKVAIQGPVEIMRCCHEAVGLCQEVSVKGSKLAISDAGCAVLLLKAAIQSAWLNVVVNLNCIKDEEFKKALRDELIPMMEKDAAVCDAVFADVESRL
jgi:formiminotetrahydrofolate cyclodeaminase